MKPIPDTESPAVLRTDFADDQAWTRLCGLISSPISSYSYLAHVTFLDDPLFADVTPAALLGRIASDYRHPFIVIADRTTFSEPEQPLLVMDLSDEPGKTFRAPPTRIQTIENNLSIANMRFEDFAADVDEDGVFRSFPGEAEEIYQINTTPPPPARKKKPSPPKTLLGRALIYTYKLLRGKPGS